MNKKDLWKIYLKSGWSLWLTTFLCIIKNFLLIFGFYWLSIAINIFFSEERTIQNLLINFAISISMIISSLVVKLLWKISLQKNINICLILLKREIASVMFKSHPKMFSESRMENNSFLLYDSPSEIRDLFFHVNNLNVDSLINLLFSVGFITYFSWMMGIIVLGITIIAILILSKIFFMNMKFNEKDFYLKSDLKEKLGIKFREFPVFFAFNKKEQLSMKMKKIVDENSNHKIRNEIKRLNIFSVYVLGIALFEVIPMIIASIFLIFNLFNINYGIYFLILSLNTIIIRESIELYRSFPSYKFTYFILEDYSEYYEKKENHLQTSVNWREIKIENLLLDLYNGGQLNIPNLIINSGDKICFQGESGSGKSTLLKMIMQYIENENIIFFNSQNHKILPDLTLFSFIDNVTSFLEQWNIEENILFGNENLRSQMNQLLIDFKLKDINTKNLINSLSEGEKQRVAIIRSLLHIKENGILVIDEGLSKLDNSLVNIIEDYMLKRENLTLIIAGHNLNFEKYQKVVLLNEEN